MQIYLKLPIKLLLLHIKKSPKMHFREDVNMIVEYARDEAMRTGHFGISPDHLMLAILRHGDNEAVHALSALGIEPAAFKKYLDSMMMQTESIPYDRINDVHLAESAKSALNMAVLEATKAGRDSTRPTDLLTGICRTTGSITGSYLNSRGITASGLAAAFAPAKHRNAANTPNPKDIANALEAQIRSSILSGKDDKVNFS